MSDIPDDIMQAAVHMAEEIEDLIFEKDDIFGAAKVIARALVKAKEQGIAEGYQARSNAGKVLEEIAWKQGKEQGIAEERDRERWAEHDAMVAELVARDRS